jgi:hypothetical protein
MLQTCDVGDLVLLKVLEPSKLEERQTGPFIVISNENGRCNLKHLESGQIIVRNSSLLTRFIPPVYQDSSVDFIPIKILEEMNVNDEIKYLVKYKGYGTSSNEWISGHKLLKFPKLLSEWKKRQSSHSLVSKSTTSIIPTSSNTSASDRKKLSTKSSHSYDYKKDKNLIEGVTGSFCVLQILTHLPARVNYRFVVTVDDPKFYNKRLVLFKNQIENQSIIESYYKNNQIQDKQSFKRSYHLGGDVIN